MYPSMRAVDAEDLLMQQRQLGLLPSGPPTLRANDLFSTAPAVAPSLGVDAVEPPPASSAASSLIAASNAGLTAGMSEEEILRLAGLTPKKVGKGSRPKKPKDMPRRPLSAYNIFFKEERGKILAEIPSPTGSPQENPETPKSGNGDSGEDSGRRRRGPSRSRSPSPTPTAPRNDAEGSAGVAKKGPSVPHGKIGFENLAKTIGARWKTVRPECRNHYKKLADADMDRYRREMDEYHRIQKDREKERKDRNAREREEDERRRTEATESLRKELDRVREKQERMETERKKKMDALSAAAANRPAYAMLAEADRKRNLDALSAATFVQREHQRNVNSAAAATTSDNAESDYSRSYLKRMRLSTARPQSQAIGSTSVAGAADATASDTGGLSAVTAASLLGPSIAAARGFSAYEVPEARPVDSAATQSSGSAYAALAAAERLRVTERLSSESFGAAASLGNFHRSFASAASPIAVDTASDASSLLLRRSALIQHRQRQQQEQDMQIRGILAAQQQRREDEVTVAEAVMAARLRCFGGGSIHGWM